MGKLSGAHLQTSMDGANNNKAMYTDAICQSYVKQAMEQYIKSLCLSPKHVYQALPRLLSLWFELAAVECPAAESTEASSSNANRQFEFTAFGKKRHSNNSEGRENK